MMNWCFFLNRQVVWNLQAIPGPGIPSFYLQTRDNAQSLTVVNPRNIVSSYARTG